MTHLAIDQGIKRLGLVLVVLFLATSLHAQCTKLLINPVTGQLDCSPTKLTGSATFAFGSAIATAACGQGPSTITITGAAVGDPVFVGSNPALAAGLNVFGKVTSTNTVTIEVCNLTGVSQTPGSTTYNAIVIH
jgi:hypothetical protein